jgi:hypothetical protein
VTFEDKIPKMPMKPYNSSETSKKEVAYFLPGVWRCPPAIKSPPRMEDQGID